MIAGLRHATDGLREEWRTGHLSVVGLPPTERFLVVGSLLIIASACVLVVFAAIGGGALGPEIGVVGKYVGAGIRGPLRVPVIVVPLTCLGLAVGQAAVAAAAARTGGGRARRMVVAIVLTNLALGGIAATTQGAVDAAIDAVPAGNMLVSGLWATTAALGFGSAVAVTALVIARPSAGRWLTPVLAALPFLAVSMALLLAAGPEGRLTPLQQVIYPDYPPVFTVVAAILAPLLFLVGLVSGLLFLLALWQATTWSRASARLVATSLGSLGSRHGWLLPLLLGMKLTWLVLGLTGLLPPLLGGAADAWSLARTDDATSWAFAAVLATAAGVWLLAPRTPLREKRALRWAPAAVVSLAAFHLVLAAVPMVTFTVEGIAPATSLVPVPDDPLLATCSAGAPLAPASWYVSCIGRWLVSWQNAWILIVVMAALIAGLAIHVRRPGDRSWVFLVVLGVWGLPRAVAGAQTAPPPELPGLDSLPAPNAPQPETMDAAITVLVLVLAILWWMRRQQTVGPSALIVVIVVSTLAIHGGTLVPTATLAAFAAVAIVFPVVYDLCFDSENLNEPTPDRAARVLGDVGIRAVALTLLAGALVVGVAGSSSSTTQLAFYLLGVPIIATVTAASISSRSKGTSMTPDPARLQRTLVPFVAGGAIVLVAALIGGAVHQPLLRPLYPSAAERVAGLEARIQAFLDAIGAIGAAPDENSGTRVDGLSAEEITWLRQNPPPDCARLLWANWRTYVADLRESGLLIDAAFTTTGGASPDELTLFREKRAALPRQADEHLRLTVVSLATAKADCAG